MHYDILTSDLIQRAAQLARSLGHSYVGSAHLLLVMAREPGAVGQTLRLLGMDPDLTEAMARLLYGQGTPELPLPQGLTGESRELLRGAAREAKHLGSREITPQHLLLAMARRENSDAYELLKLNGISTDELFTHAVDYLHWEQGAPVRGKKEAVTTKLLEQFSEDLILKASGMDPVIGREREIDTVIGILCRKNKNNPALVGEPGVGKTAIAEGLAQRMAVGNVPPQLKDKRLVSLNMASLVAGTKYRGEFEERLRDVLGEIRRSGDVILSSMKCTPSSARARPRALLTRRTSSSPPWVAASCKCWARRPGRNTGNILKRTRRWSAGSARWWWRSRGRRQRWRSSGR